MKLNANRHVTGVLRGFDQFMNIVLDNCVDEKLKADLGMVVSGAVHGQGRATGKPASLPAIDSRGEQHV